jgi:hypothetical protein
MSERIGTCSCGQLRVICEGEPLRVSMCHCFACQKRSGAPFAVQARWPREKVRTEGTAHEWKRTGDEGSTATFRFCPTCGSTLWYTADKMPDVIAVAVGAFSDTSLPVPIYSVYNGRKHPWVVLPEGTERID